MAVIIGRKQEQKELSRLYHSDEAEMVVVYGRRRVGKTYLVTVGEASPSCISKCKVYLHSL